MQPLTRCRCAPQVHALHRKRALAVGVVRHWAFLFGVSILGSAWCARSACAAVRVTRDLITVVGLSVRACAAGAFGGRGVPRARRLSFLCFWTVRASVNMCDYATNDKTRYNPDTSIMEVPRARRQPPPPARARGAKPAAR
jgi:hypothetical protein